MKPLLLLLMSTLLMGQVNRQSRIIEYEPDGTDQAIRFEKIFQLSNVFYHHDPVLKIVTFYADTKEKLDESEALFRRYYKPRQTNAAADRNIEITLNILHGKSGPAEKGDAPASLNAVIQQLKQVTNLTTFNNLETQILRVRDGKRIESSGVLVWQEVPESAAPNYNLRADLSLTGQSIKLNDARVGVRMPYKVGDNQYQFREVGINTSLDMKSGQQVVVGKTNASSKDGALIFVISARIVD
jgi:hypothetical protein